MVRRRGGYLFTVSYSGTVPYRQGNGGRIYEEDGGVDQHSRSSDSFVARRQYGVRGPGMQPEGFGICCRGWMKE